MCERQSAHRRIPRDSTTAKHLPAGGQPAKRPDTKADCPQRYQPCPNRAKGQQANGNSAEAHRCDRNSAGSEQHADRVAAADGYPCFHRSAQHVKAVTEPDVDERQAEKTTPAAIFILGGWKIAGILICQKSCQIPASCRERPDGKAKNCQKIDDNS